MLFYTCFANVYALEKFQEHQFPKAGTNASNLPNFECAEIEAGV